MFVSDGAGRVGQGPDEAEDGRFEEALASFFKVRVSTCEAVSYEEISRASLGNDFSLR